MSQCGGSDESRHDIDVVRGKTVSRIIRLEIAPFIYKDITAIEQSAPVLITAPGHELPEGWRVAVVGVRGMRQINARNDPPRLSDWHKATIVNSNQIQLNDVAAVGYNAYTTGGVLKFATPMDWTGFSARIDVRTPGGTLLDTLTDADHIQFDIPNSTILYTFPASMTEVWEEPYVDYELEMRSADAEPVVIAPASGRIRLRDETTTSG